LFIRLLTDSYSKENEFEWDPDLKFVPSISSLFSCVCCHIANGFLQECLPGQWLWDQTTRGRKFSLFHNFALCVSFGKSLTLLSLGVLTSTSGMVSVLWHALFYGVGA
jgi:hypothetical protein